MPHHSLRHSGAKSGMVKDTGYEALISTIRKSVKREPLGRKEVNQALNYLWDKWPRGGKLGTLRMGVALVRNPVSFLSVPLFAMILADHMTAEVLCGLYDSVKDHGLYGEEDTQYEVPYAVSSTGTGGKEIPTINVSTASAIIAASAGGKVLRSGTRSVFGTAGATDFLKAHNIPRITDLALVPTIIRETGLAFIEGEIFSPGAYQIVDPLLQARSDIKTFARILSYPFKHAIALLRPLGSKYAYRGISLPITQEVAEALRSYRGFERGIVVFSQDVDGRAFDELSTVGLNVISEFTKEGLITYTMWPQEVGLPLREARAIETRGRKHAYSVTMEVFKGKRRRGDPYAELLALNAGGMLYAGGFVSNIREGLERAMSAIMEGLPYRLIERYGQAYHDLSHSGHAMVGTFSTTIR